MTTAIGLLICVWLAVGIVEHVERRRKKRNAELVGDHK